MSPLLNMPGCTAPNCTNSSQKGFKLYHFPRDMERNLIWIQNCRRERGWKPTRHTCVCEVHFEDSQFESHRADGLRKLKPYAIPTIFNHSSSQRPKRRRKVSSNVQCADHTYLRQSDEDADDPETIVVEEHNMSEVKQDSFRSAQLAGRGRGRRRGRPVKRQIADVDDWTPDQARAVRGRKRGRPAGSLNKKNLAVSPSRKSVRISRRGRRKWVPNDRREIKEKNNANLKDGSLKDDAQCYVCNKLVEEGTPLHTKTATTKVHMYQRLRKVIAGELELVVDEEEVLCPHCTRLLNYMDRIEVELNMLNKAILNCMRRKFGLGVAFEDKIDEPALLDLEMQQDSPSTIDEMDKFGFSQDCKDEAESVALDCHWIDAEENHISGPVTKVVRVSEKMKEQNLDQSATTKVASPTEEFQCRICMFKTCYKSVIVFHLRQHLKAFYRCDFCNVSLPHHSHPISKSESCLSEQFHESSDDINSEISKTQSLVEVSKEHVTAVEEIDQCNSNAIMSKNITETENVKSHSSEPQMLMTVVSHSSNGDELTVLNDTGMSVVRGAQGSAFSITLAYADVNTSSLQVLNEKDTEPEEVCESVNKDLESCILVDQLQEKQKLHDINDPADEDETKSAESVVYSGSHEHLSQQTLPCEKDEQSSEVIEKLNSGRDGSSGIVQVDDIERTEVVNPDLITFQSLKIDPRNPYDAKDKMLPSLEDWV